MFESIKRQFPSVFTNNQVYYGTSSVHYEQIQEPIILGNSKNTFNNSDAEKVATAVTCIKVLGDTLSRLPVKVFQATPDGNQVDKSDYRYDLLNYSPDGIVTSNNFFGTLEYNRNLKGNSFARIFRDKLSGKVISIRYLPNNLVAGYKIVKDQLFYNIYEEKDGKNIEKVIPASDILHFKMISKNGIWGINPIEAQRLNLSTLYKSKNTIDKYYENNAFSPLALKSTIPDAQYQKIFNEAMTKFKHKNVGADNAGSVIQLPPYTELQQLSLDPVDQKFIESSKFDTSQIAAFYGVPPDMVGVWEYSKFSNVEQSQLNFKVNTLAAILRMYRQELEMKLLTTKERQGGKSIEFVTQALLETDINTRLNYYKSMMDLGVITPNQVALLEGLPTFEGGDKHYKSSQTPAIEDTNVDSSVNI